MTAIIITAIIAFDFGLMFGVWWTSRGNNLTAHSTTDIVGQIDKVLHEPCLAIDAWRKVERAKEVIRKFSNEKGGVE